MILNNRRLTAYPLFLKDPYFSFWCAGDNPTEQNTTFWHGEEKPFYGTLNVDGKIYKFLGKGNDLSLNLKKTEITAFETTYYFTKSDFKFKISFLSPLTPDNLEILSLPVTYLKYSFNSKNKHTVSVRLAMEERCVYNTCFCKLRHEKVRINTYTLNERKVISMGLLNQKPLSNSMDETGADWGYFYLTGNQVGYFDTGRVWCFAENNHINTTNIKDFFCVGFDDIISIFYFGEYLHNYWQRKGKTIFDALLYAIDNENYISALCTQFDKNLVKKAIDFSDDYLFVLYISLRQVIAGHKLVENSNGKLLFLSKEFNSDGCVATADVSYPSFPLFLIYNPELVKGMILPIFDFARMPIWKYDYAPHDVGIYPYCLGQYYAIKNFSKENEIDLKIHNIKDSQIVPFYFELPLNLNIYDDNLQMPVEECGNLIILSYLYTLKSKNNNMIYEYLDLFEKWANYLVKVGLIPFNQLSSDDFSGHLDKNANLSIKAICAIRCYAEICKIVNKIELYKKYKIIAFQYSAEWKKLYLKKDHSVLSLNSQKSYSLKYNLAIDNLLGLNLFDDVSSLELKYYEKKKYKYGIPLDSRNKYTKTDWLMWVSSLGNEANTNEYANYIVKFNNDCMQRVPFPDWISVIKPKYFYFRNRTVQGGCFMPLLKKIWKKYKTKK